MRILKKIRTNSTTTSNAEGKLKVFASSPNRTTSPAEDELEDVSKEEVFEPSFTESGLNKELLEMNNYEELDRVIEVYENESGEQADKHYKQLLNVVCSEEVSAEALNKILQRLPYLGDKHLVREAFRTNPDKISDETVQSLIYDFTSYHGSNCDISDMLKCSNISLYTVKEIFYVATGSGSRSMYETEQRILLDFVGSKFLNKEEYDSSKTLPTKKLSKLLSQKIFKVEEEFVRKVLNQITELGIQQSPAYINNNHKHLFVWKTHINNNVSDVRLTVWNETTAYLNYYLKGSGYKTDEATLADALQALTEIFK